MLLTDDTVRRKEYDRINEAEQLKSTVAFFKIGETMASLPARVAAPRALPRKAPVKKAVGYAKLNKESL